jgi:hypothetical protein
MDGLALLCNLFADGPVTLGRLRAAHVASLGELEREPPERLAVCLHASVPQARAFVEEARKLMRRLAEAGPLAGRSPPALRPLACAVAPAVLDTRDRPAARGDAEELALRAGLVPGLDEGACARLALHQVRTLQALSESAGLALARRTGIPYSTLLELARRARRVLAEQGRASDPALGLREHELVPLARSPLRFGTPPAVAARPGTESELARTDEFTLPVEPEPAAGPFG